MSDGRTDDTAYRLFSVKPCEELLHFLVNTVWRGGYIMDSLMSEHSTDYMLFVCSVLTNLYLATFAITGWKERSLPSTKFLFTEWHIIMLDCFEHDTHNRIDIVRRRSIFHVLNPKLSGNGRANLLHVQSDAFNLRGIHDVICQVLCHSTQFAVKAQRTQSAI